MTDPGILILEVRNAYEIITRRKHSRARKIVNLYPHIHPLILIPPFPFYRTLSEGSTCAASHTICMDVSLLPQNLALKSQKHSTILLPLRFHV